MEVKGVLDPGASRPSSSAQPTICRDDRGFIFTLDAALAVVIVMLALAGVASVGVPGFYESYGYLRLERYANDALEAFYNVGVFDENGNLITPYENLRRLLDAGNIAEAETVAENWLIRIFPSDLCFRFVVGDENSPLLDNVFPEHGNDAAWISAFENAEELAAGHRIWVIGGEFVPVKLYVWRWPKP